MEKYRNRKLRIVSLVLIGFFLIGSTAFAQQAIMVRHPNIYAAQLFIESAIAKIVAAQHANSYHLGGHAAKALQLLRQADQEIKLAAQASEN